MPTMAGAFAYDFYKNRDIIDASQLGLVAIGFVCAFIAAVLVVRSLLDFVSKHGFALFAYWRIIVGLIGLTVLMWFGNN
jgi:undecaprenyl-diphosphatase